MDEPKPTRYVVLFIVVVVVLLLVVAFIIWYIFFEQPSQIFASVPRPAPNTGPSQMARDRQRAMGSGQYFGPIGATGSVASDICPPVGTFG